MWFPATELCRAPQHLLWAGPSGRPGIRRVFMLAKKGSEAGIRAWQGEESSGTPVNPARHLATTLFHGTQCKRPFDVFQSWDLASRPFIMLLAESCATQLQGRPLVDLSWDAPTRSVTSTELEHARDTAAWQGGFTTPSSWGVRELEWLIQGLDFAREGELSALFAGMRVRRTPLVPALPVIEIGASPKVLQVAQV